MARRFKIPHATQVMPAAFSIGPSNTSHVMDHSGRWFNAPTVPTWPRSDYYNLPQNGGGIMPPHMVPHMHPSLNQHPAINFAANHPANFQAILLSLGIGGGTTPLSGVTRPGRPVW